MRKLQRIAVLTIVLFISVGCDQATKSVAQNQLIDRKPITFLNNTVRIEYAENPGAFLSLGARLPADAQRWIFTGVVTLLLLGMLIYALRKAEKIHIILLVAAALYIGGGMGNLIDRLINEGRVIDFLNVGIGNFRTGVFNVADMAIMAAVGLIVIFSLQSWRANSSTQIDEEGAQRDPKG